jgi:hypothetical protein
MVNISQSYGWVFSLAASTTHAAAMPCVGLTVVRQSPPGGAGAEPPRLHGAEESRFQAGRAVEPLMISSGAR